MSRNPVIWWFERAPLPRGGNHIAADGLDSKLYTVGGLTFRRKAGEQAQNISETALDRKDQFALEIDRMAQCVRQNIRPRTPGEEGLQKKTTAAIYESARSGSAVKECK